MNLIFKKNFDKNNATTITTNKEQKINDLSIYSKNYKNIYQSGLLPVIKIQKIKIILMN